ncbi:MAG: sugar ABC transporter permease [Ruminococcaceae bacterium]|nr:sugar ABC transporter permease [Oscillospiraceae bacterium]
MNADATVKVAAVNKKKKKPASLDRKKARAGWWFVLPFVAIFIAVYLPMIYDSIRFSFHEIEILQAGGYELIYVGWDNYSEALFVDAKYVTTLVEGLKQLILDIPAIVIFSLFMAIVLNDKMPGRTIFRAIFFIPVILSTGIIDSIDQSGNSMMDYMGSSDGISTGAEESQTTANDIISAVDIQKLFANMKIGQGLVDYVVGLVNDIYNIVNRSGVQMLIFLAGLQSINPAIYESCKIDGASSWETFWKITFPMISPMILVNTIYTVIDSFTSASNTVMAYIDQVYQNAANGQVLSSAMSWMYFLIVMLLIVVVAAVLSLYTFYQRRD